MEVKNIFEDLCEAEKKSNSISKLLFPSKLEKYSFFGLFLFSILTVLLSLFELTREFSDYMMLGSLIFFLVYSFGSIFVTAFKVIKNPTLEFLQDSKSRVNEQLKLVQKLSIYNSWTIEFAIIRIQHETDKIKNRFGLLIGAFDKLGLIPALVILYLTYVKVMDDKMLQEIPSYILAFICGVYVGALASASVISRYDFLKRVLEQAKELAIEREEFQKR